MKASSILLWAGKFVALFILYSVCFVSGSLFVSGVIPEGASEPGLVSQTSGLIIMGLTNVMLIIVLIRTSTLHGWKLALSMSFVYYGVVTFIMQIETWYFLTSITVGSELMLRLFLMGIPVAIIFVPIAVWIVQREQTQESFRLDLSHFRSHLTLKLGAIAIVYVILYWCAGYFIAWQNPALRTFYTGSAKILPFWTHTINTVQADPWLFPFQVMRGLLWTLFAMPIILYTRFSLWWTALLVGLFFSLPQNVGHILENPLIPITSVRMSHLIETSSSTFIFGLIVTYILYPRKRESF